MTLPLLHSPIRTAQQLGAVIGQRETIQLEFKSSFWTRRGTGHEHIAEAAKDVAAMANALGGDILIGVAARHSSAIGFAAWTDSGREDHCRELLRDWLHNYLKPASFSPHTSLALVEAPAQSACASVLVVTVPPARQLVAAVADPNQASVRFPIRSLDGTRWADMEEAMLRFTVSSRAAYLALASVLRQGENRVRIVSRYDVIAASRNRATRHRLKVRPVNGAHGLIGELSESMVLFQASPWTRSAEGIHAVIPGGRAQPFPLDFVRAAWRVGDIIHLALVAPLVWEDEDLSFEA